MCAWLTVLHVSVPGGTCAGVPDMIDRTAGSWWSVCRSTPKALAKATWVWIRLELNPPGKPISKPISSSTGWLRMMRSLKMVENDALIEEEGRLQDDVRNLGTDTF